MDQLAEHRQCVRQRSLLGLGRRPDIAEAAGQDESRQRGVEEVSYYVLSYSLDHSIIIRTITFIVLNTSLFISFAHYCNNIFNLY